MTWKEFKDEVEKAGVKDDDELWYIDCHPHSPLHFDFSERQELGVAIS